MKEKYELKVFRNYSSFTKQLKFKMHFSSLESLNKFIEKHKNEVNNDLNYEYSFKNVEVD